MNGALLGWLSRGLEAADQYGWLGWWVAFFVGALTFAFLTFLLAISRYAWVNAAARNKWAGSVSGFNPLDRDFRNQRLQILDVMHPINRMVDSKRFYDCEIMGPASIFFHEDTVLGGVISPIVHFLFSGPIGKERSSPEVQPHRLALNFKTVNSGI